MREGDGLVGRRVVGRSFPKQILIQGWAQKNGIKFVTKKKLS